MVISNSDCHHSWAIGGLGSDSWPDHKKLCNKKLDLWSIPDHSLPNTKCPYDSTAVCDRLGEQIRVFQTFLKPKVLQRYLRAIFQ